SRVGLEDTRGQRDHRVQLVLLDQHSAKRLVGIAGTEEHTIRRDRRGTAPEAQHSQYQRHEQELCLLRLHAREERGLYIAVIETSLERWIGQYNIKRVLRLRPEALGEGGAQGVLIVDIGLVNAVQHKIHCGNAEHRDVEIEAVKHALLPVPAI